MKIAILLLCHESPRAVAEALQSPFYRHADIRLYVHYDARRSAAHLAELQTLLPEGLSVHWVEDRVPCRWGEFSLVQATHRLMQAALADAAFQADRLMLVSTRCLPYRPLSSLQAFLRQRPDIEFIEAVDSERRRWVQDGLQEERYRYFFPFNYQRHRRWFERLVRLQRLLRVRRALPSGLRIHFGSQWFCLTRSTAAQVCTELAQPRLQAFFRHCWIPDEFAIQSLVAQCVPAERIAGHSLTYCEFDPQGRPLVLDNGHLPHLLRQPFFFARKVSPTAASLKADIAQRLHSEEAPFWETSPVGMPTPDYRCFVARANTVLQARSRVATLADEIGGVMAHNDRRYIVLWSACLPFAQALMTEARAQWPQEAPVFGELFRPDGLDLGWGRQAHRGLRTQHLAWRDYAPASLLYQVVQSHPTEPAVLLVDPATPSWIRDFVRTDVHAVLVNLDPLDLTKVQRAQAALAHAPRHWRIELVQATYQAAFSNGWLPQEYFVQPDPKQALACQTLQLDELDASCPFAVLRALKACRTDTLIRQFFHSDHNAWVSLRRALQPTTLIPDAPPASEAR